MTAPATQTFDEIVPPATTGREAAYVLGACVLISVLAAGLILVRRTVPPVQELAEYQLSAFSGLNTVEQGLYNDLLAASLEIDLYHADALQWPSVDWMREQYIAPFARDLSWKKRGALRWRQDVPNIELQHTVAYFALSEDYDTTGSFILWMTHKHNMIGPMADAFRQQRGPGLPGAGPLAGPMIGVFTAATGFINRESVRRFKVFRLCARARCIERRVLQQPDELVRLAIGDLCCACFHKLNRG